MTGVIPNTKLIQFQAYQKPDIRLLSFLPQQASPRAYAKLKPDHTMKTEWHT